MTTPAHHRAPRSSPLKTLRDLLEWAQPSSADAIALASCYQARIPLATPSTRVPPGKRQLLVCHDMMGGYLDQDALIQGSLAPAGQAAGSKETSMYSIAHWQFIDLFVYFSHNLVTVPPPAWTNAAHRHQVRVLGTFITEWKEGAALCAELLASPETIDKAVQNLVAIAAWHGFDGWLINIENAIAPGKTSALKSFVAKLKAAMERSVPHSVVLWYDSVTFPHGALDWQNELNHLNGDFYDAADGIFLNYGWTPGQLDKSAVFAEARRSSRANVFVGVDVFGRGVYGGGGFNVREALETIRDGELSAALFAPGWVYENRPDYFEAQEEFWKNVVAGHGEPARPLVGVSLHSTFDAAQRLLVSSGSELLVSESGRQWPLKQTASAGGLFHCNMSSQSVQPSFLPLEFSHGFSGQEEAKTLLALGARLFGEPWSRATLANLRLLLPASVLDPSSSSPAPFDGVAGGLEVRGHFHRAAVQHLEVSSDTALMRYVQFASQTTRTLRLFKTRLALSDPLVVAFTVRNLCPGKDVNVALQLVTDGSIQNLDLCPHPFSPPPHDALLRIPARESHRVPHLLLEWLNQTRSASSITSLTAKTAQLAPFACLDHERGEGPSDATPPWTTHFFLVRPSFLGIDACSREVREIRLQVRPSFEAFERHELASGPSAVNIHVGAVNVQPLFALKTLASLDQPVSLDEAVAVAVAQLQLQLGSTSPPSPTGTHNASEFTIAVSLNAETHMVEITWANPFKAHCDAFGPVLDHYAVYLLSSTGAKWWIGRSYSNCFVASADDLLSGAREGEAFSILVEAVSVLHTTAHAGWARCAFVSQPHA